MTSRILTLVVTFAVVALGSAVVPISEGLSASSQVQSLRGSDADAQDVAPETYRIQDGVALGRAYRQQPPLVPHQVEKYEIDLKVNQCIRCHEWPNSDKEQALKMSDFHYIDQDGVRRDVVDGRRYFCLSCHVPQADAKPLVENNFRPAGQ